MRTFTYVPTAIRAAFDNIKVMPSAITPKHAEIAEIIVDKLHTKVGIVSRPDWNTNLSFQTAKQLDAPMFDPVRKPAIPEIGKGYSIWNQVKNAGGYNRMVA